MVQTHMHADAHDGTNDNALMHNLAALFLLH